jgi:arylsulfatase A-like enzyme
MADDMGWGQTGYYNHPILKTPNLDSMAKAGLRFDRFYAASAVCSPTRASVLTGRSSMRTGVPSHGHSLRHQEKTIAQALKDVGYATGHFGKWHLNGMRGPGVPILKEDTHNPGTFGFDEWVSVTNFFDRDPIMSRQGEFTEFAGDSSEIAIDLALEFIGKHAKADQPSFTVVWYGTPHDPFRATAEDMRPFVDLDERSKTHYGELVAMDRSIGTLRKELRELGIEKNTLFWFCSDNGGLPRLKPESVGGLRGNKGTVYEGGLRVPGIIEWPAGIPEPRITEYPAVVMDIFPTIAEIVGLPDSTMVQPQDGVSLVKLFTKEIGKREKPIPFHYAGSSVVLDNNIKLLHVGKKKKKYELYDLATDPHETHNLYTSAPDQAKRMRKLMDAWVTSMNASVEGKDYPAGRVLPGDPAPRFWMQVEAYRPYFNEWKERPEYKSRLREKKRKP